MVSRADDTKRWQDWLNLALGIWLFFSPWMLGFSFDESALWNTLIVGIHALLAASRQSRARTTYSVDLP